MPNDFDLKLGLNHTSFSLTEGTQRQSYCKNALLRDTEEAIKSSLRKFSQNLAAKVTLLTASSMSIPTSHFQINFNAVQVILAIIFHFTLYLSII